MQTIIKIFAAIGGLASLALVLALAYGARGDLTAQIGSPVSGAALSQTEDSELPETDRVLEAKPSSKGIQLIRKLTAPMEIEVIAGEAMAVSSMVISDEPMVEGPGIVITSLVEGGPAVQAGMTRGDILLSIDGQPVDESLSLWTELEDKAEGDSVTLEYQHGDEIRSGTAFLEVRGESAWLGIAPCGAGMGMLPAIAMNHAFPLEEAMHFIDESHIVEVVEGSAAELAGLQAGDRILAVDGVELDADADLAERLASFEPGQAVSLSIERPGEGDAEAETLDLQLELGAHPDDPERAFLGVSYASTMTIESIEGMPFEDMIKGHFMEGDGIHEEFRHDGDKGHGGIFKFFHRGGDSHESQPEEPAVEQEGQSG